MPNGVSYRHLYRCVSGRCQPFRRSAWTEATAAEFYSSGRCRKCGGRIIPVTGRRKRGRPKERGSLRAKVLRCLAESPLPCTTPDLTLICAFGRPNARVQVDVVLRRLLAAGEIRRSPPLPGTYAVRWQL